MFGLVKRFFVRRKRKDAAPDGPKWTMDHLKTEGQCLVPNHLKIVIRTLARKNSNESFVLYGVAIEVLRYFFGSEWTNQNVFAMDSFLKREYSEGRRFMRSKTDEEFAGYVHQQRVLELAQSCFNLQHIDGLDERLSQLRHKTFESAYGELDCACLLTDPSLNLRFVRPQGTKGLDYEAEVSTSKNRIICCEIKTKMEKTNPGVATIQSTIKKARSQLPQTSPGVVVIKLPLSWQGDLDLKFASEMNSALRDEFAASDRLVGIVFTWDKQSKRPDGYLFSKHYNVVLNESSTMFDADIYDFAGRIGRRNNSDWVDLRELVQLELRTLDSTKPLARVDRPFSELVIVSDKGTLWQGLQLLTDVDEEGPILRISTATHGEQRPSLLSRIGIGSASTSRDECTLKFTHRKRSYDLAMGGSNFRISWKGTAASGASGGFKFQCQRFPLTSFQKAGRIRFTLNHPSADWLSNDDSYSFPPKGYHKQGNVIACAKKVRAFHVELAILGPLGHGGEFNIDFGKLPGPEGVSILFKWSRGNIDLFANGFLAESRRWAGCV